MHVFRTPLPDAVSLEQVEKSNTSFTIEDVRDWAEDTGNIAARFRFFEAFNVHSEFYQLVAKPLLSLRTVGSIDVERKVKPIKNDIFTKNRNRLLDPKGVAMMRASENLNYIMKAKKSLGKRITDSL